jgi:DNA sulfur modification protein DndB
MTTLTKTAFSIGNEDVELYLTVMKANEVFQVSKVSRVDENPETGYQRHLSGPRAKSIAEYLNSGNLIPGAVILSAQDNANIEFSDGELSIELIPNSLFVIDGQHRLYGSKLSEKDISLPVCIFKGLDHTSEVQYFIDINSTQKGVPKTLRIELMKFLAEDDSIDSIRAKLFDELGTEVDSPLYGKLSPISSGRGRISHVPFKDAIDPILTKQPLSRLDFSDKKKLITNYLLATQGVLEEIEGDDKRLTSAVFFQSIFDNFEQICNLSMIHFRSYSAPSIKQIIEGIKHIDFSKFSGTNRETIKNLSQEIQSLVDIHSRKLGEIEDLF